MLSRHPRGRWRVVLLHELSVGLPEDWTEEQAQRYHDAALEALRAAREVDSIKQAAAEIVAHSRDADPFLHLDRLTAKLRAARVQRTPFGLYLEKADDHSKEGLGLGGRR